VAEIIFYHQFHFQANGELAHGKHDLDSIARPPFFCPTNVTSLQGPHLDSIGLKLHHQANI
jgi:hypothetical protein